MYCYLNNSTSLWWFIVIGITLKIVSAWLLASKRSTMNIKMHKFQRKIIRYIFPT